MIGGRRVLGRSERFGQGGTLGYLVVEIGHWLLNTTRQSGCKVRGAPDVAHLVVSVVDIGIRVVRPLGWAAITVHETMVVNSRSSFAENRSRTHSPLAAEPDKEIRNGRQTDEILSPRR